MPPRTTTPHGSPSNVQRGTVKVVVQLRINHDVLHGYEQLISLDSLNELLHFNALVKTTEAMVQKAVSQHPLPL